MRIWSITDAWVMHAMLASIEEPRLRPLGIQVREGPAHPEEALFDRLEAMFGDGAHSRYNSLIRRVVSFARVAAIACVRVPRANGSIAYSPRSRRQTLDRAGSYHRALNEIVAAAS